MEMNNRVAVVTGAASGIGAASARAFAAAGARVAAVDLNLGGARQTAAATGGIALACDVGNEAAVNAMVSEVRAQLGEIDLFFHNAGVATGGDPLTTPLDVWQAQWQVNVMAHVYAIRALLPAMLERGDGYFIHTASMAGILTSQGNMTYAATKHAVVGIAEWMAITYHARGVRTSLLAPLGVRTPMLGNPDSTFARNALGPLKEPDEVGQMVLDAVREERFLILTDPVAQTWMERKTSAPERWLTGMRRLQAQLDDANARGAG